MRNQLEDKYIKPFIYVGLIVLSFVLLFTCFGYTKQKSISPNAQFQTSPIATPCPGPAIPTNMITPCNPAKTPTAQESVENAERQKAWQAERKLLLISNFPLTSENFIDVDGDGQKDNIFYQIKPWKNDFEGLLKITSAQGKILWKHEFVIGADDLLNWLDFMSDADNKKINLANWVKNAFNPDFNYSFLYEKTAIKDTDIDEEQLKYAAKIYKFSKLKVREEILSQAESNVFSYRAEWREDLVQLVYVRSIKRFITFSRGY